MIKSLAGIKIGSFLVVMSKLSKINDDINSYTSQVWGNQCQKKEKCIQSNVLIVEQTQKYLLSQQQTEMFIAKNVYQNIDLVDQKNKLNLFRVILSK